MPAKKRRKQVFRVMNEKCPYCEKGTDPTYKESVAIREFMTDRARIIPATRSGLCSRHQKKLGVAIKRARHLGLLPYSEQL